jgi:outer membrane receptor for ferrienterochelin and colicins
MFASIVRVSARFAVLMLALMFTANVAEAQNGTLRGRVADAAGAPIANAAVSVQQGGSAVGSATSGADGTYSVSVPAGTYLVSVRRIGFAGQRRDGVVIPTGGSVEVNLTLSAVAAMLNSVVVSATPAAGGGEKVLDAPAHVGVVTSLEVQERPSLSWADHLKSQAGVDVSAGGLVQSNIVSRGFNNAFSGAMLVMQDNRFSSVPSLRVNVPFLTPSVNEDIERMEVLLGPAAALYGPNSASGVLHVITKSPFTSQGTVLTVDAGVRGVLRGSGRWAQVFGNKLGVKLSGEYMRGQDWEYIDPAEPDSINRPTGAIVAGVGVQQKVLNNRDFDITKMAGEARVDFRPKAGVEWINSFGMSQAGNYIEITGANGAAQARNWGYMSAQSRLRWNRTFAQVFYNTSNAGNEDSLDASGTFLLRTGKPIVDNSRVLTGQIQHAMDFGAKTSIVVGGDYIATNPRSGGTINGRNEDIDDVKEMGGYVHGTYRLSDKWDLVGALRMDTHSEQEDPFYSPRAAIVFKPNQNQNIRFTYNCAFSTPANFSFFLDLPQGVIPIPGTTGYTIRALGVPSSGFFYPTGSTNGRDGLYMRSIFPVLNTGAVTVGTAPHTRIDAHAGSMYRTLVAANAAAFQTALLNAGVTAGNVGTVFNALLNSGGGAGPTPAQVRTVMMLFNPALLPGSPYVLADSVQFSELSAVDRLKSTLSSTYELGYKAILADKWRLAVNGWYQQMENFTTPAANVTPSLFMQGAGAGGLGAYIGGILAAEAGAGRVPAAAVAPLANAFTTTLASAPVGTVSMEQNGIAGDLGLTNRADLVFTYRNVEETIDLYGADMAIDYDITDRITLLATGGYISKTTFANIPSGVGPLRINAPQYKASLAARYRNETKGLSGEVRGRYTDAFQVNSGVYVGAVPVNMLLDASVTWRPTGAIGRNTTLSLSGTNLLDEQVPTFIGVPAVGRMILGRIQYTF